MTFDQQEPSANSPCTKTTFFVFGGVWALATRLSRGRAALSSGSPDQCSAVHDSLLSNDGRCCGVPQQANQGPLSPMICGNNIGAVRWVTSISLRKNVTGWASFTISKAIGLCARSEKCQQRT